MYCTVQSRGSSDTTDRESIHIQSGLLCNVEDHRKQNDKLQYREDSSDINENMKDRSPR